MFQQYNKPFGVTHKCINLQSNAVYEVGQHTLGKGCCTLCVPKKLSIDSHSNSCIMIKVSICH